MVLDMEAFRSGKASYADSVRDVTHADLYKLTDDYFDTVESIVAEVTDMGVTFVPYDAALKDPNQEAYTLGHVVVHLTATLEESASIASVLARGITFDGRLRYETPWQTIRTAQQVHARLRESRRMCKAYLDAWPDAPHLDVTVMRIPHFGPMNAIGMDVLGIIHGESHIEQLKEILRQSRNRV
jgi:chloramphenicol 3-O-phosphotransferase